MIEALGNKLSEDVKENIYQLGVKNRYFVRPFDRYISKSSERIKSNADGEPISDLCVKVAEKFPYATKTTTDTFFLGTSPVLNKEKIDYVGRMIDKFMENHK